MGEKKKKGYFKALVYMHRMETDTLSKLHADYVHPYLNKIERQLSEAEDPRPLVMTLLRLSVIKH
jgi:hypothetical protein